jgi:ABC-type sugar transport systems, permease components
MWKAKTAYIILLPIMIGLLVTSYYPAVSGLYHAFFDWNVTGKSRFIGLANFKELFSDQVFTNSIGTMFLIMVPRLLISIFVPLIMAELIFAVRSKKWQFNYRFLILLPLVVPGMVSMLIWKKMFDPINGVFTGILKAAGIMGHDQIINWLGDPNTVIPSIVFIGFPWIGGTAVLIYMSGLMNISEEVIEATVLDGCSVLRRIFKIDIPLILGQIRYFLVFGLIAGFQDYNTQIILTSGGPGYSTYVPAYYMFTKAFGDGRMGYASSIGLVLFIVIFGLSVLAFKYLRTNDGR